MLKPKSWVAASAAGVLSLCGASAAAMADGYQQRSAPVAAPFSWTGLYVGVNGGYGWSNDQTVHIDETFTPAGGVPAAFFNGNFGSLSAAGGFGGIQAGANMQLGTVVLGVELDGQWADLRDDTLATVTPPGYTIGSASSVTKFGTARPRIGLAWDRTLVYATGGLAWGRVEHTMAFRDTLGFTAFDQKFGTQVGYVVGGGLEQMLTPRLSLKVEYQYIDLGSEHYLARENVGGVISGFQINTDTHTDFHTVRLGLNYKLGQ